jgi:biopolymer transport protein ExbB/TolQ
MKPAPSHEFSLVEMFTNLANFGAEWVMYLLLGLAFLALVVSFERQYLFLTTKIDVTQTARKLLGLLEKGDVKTAEGLFKGGKAMEHRVLADALSVYAKGADSVEEIAHASMIRERQRYERSLSFLGTVGSNGPFVGLLGTVIGVIISFGELGRNPKGGLEVVGPGISEALVATAVGLIVAIPAVVVFNHFKGLLKGRLGNAEFLTRIVIAQLKQKPLTTRLELSEAAVAAEE